MSPTSHLALINVFVGDIQGGLGPFLATWLAETRDWPPNNVGLVTTIAGFVTLLLSAPLGALVDQLNRPRLLLAAACGMTLAGTLAILPSTSFFAVLVAQCLAAMGGTLLISALSALTLGIVGKKAFPKQQGRNQAFNHVGVVGAALVISWGSSRLGPSLAFWVLAALAACAIVATITTPRVSYNRHRAVGWKEDEPDDTVRKRDTYRVVFGNRRLLLVALALALFNLSNGPMLGLLGQKLVSEGVDATRWTANYVVVAQLTMIPISLMAGSIADRRGRRMLLFVACAVLPVRAVISAFVSDPYWLIGAEILDGVASGIVGVAVPVVVADLTWGSGRTQTALGAVAAVQGVGGALSAWIGGLLTVWLGWTGAFLVLGLPPLAALAILFWLEETRGSADEPRGFFVPKEGDEEAEEEAEEKDGPEEGDAAEART
jgi:MFS family permease